MSSGFLALFGKRRRRRSTRKTRKSTKRKTLKKVAAKVRYVVVGRKVLKTLRKRGKDGKVRRVFAKSGKKVTTKGKRFRSRASAKASMKKK